MRVSLLTSVASVLLLTGAAFAQGEGEFPATLKGHALDDKAIATAAEATIQGATPLAHNGYKVDLAKALVRQALAGLRQM